ncbi:MAG: TIGR01459 family HAD-type hydrolase [Pseudomonadota bacterium]
MSLQPISGLAKIAEQFDVYFIDIYGVIHDGTSIYPGALHCLEALALAGKSVLLLTNTPARSQVIVKRLETIGIPPSLYQHVISSGEVAYRHIIERSDSWYARLGDHCYFIGPSHSSLLEGSAVRLVSDIDRADFIIAAGPDDWHTQLADYEETLQQAVVKKLPLICANPNRGSSLKVQAGDIAHFYETLGGEAHYHGKPYLTFYETALNCYPQIDKNRVLVIGDALEVDIRGALAMQLACAWVTGGLHSYELEAAHGIPADEKAVRKTCDAYGSVPDYTIPGLIW